MAKVQDGDSGTPLRIVFCGDRTVGAELATFIGANGGEIVAAGVNEPPHAVSPEKIMDAAGVDPGLVFYGRGIATEVAHRKLARLEPDLGVCCGFASILPSTVLALPRLGWVNIHRSYLPYNRGLNPLAWAVIDGTPAGVTIHVMTKEVDAGAILAQAQMPVYLTDNATTLEQRADELMLQLFESTWPALRSGEMTGTPQDQDLATYHSMADCEALYRLDPNVTMSVRRLLDILRTHSGEGGSAIDLRIGPSRYTVHTRILKMVQAGPARDAPATDSPRPRTGPTETDEANQVRAVRRRVGL